MSVEKQQVAEKGKYKLYRITTGTNTYYEIHSKTSNDQYVCETSFNDQNKAYAQFSLLTKNVK